MKLRLIFFPDTFFPDSFFPILFFPDTFFPDTFFPTYIVFSKLSRTVKNHNISAAEVSFSKQFGLFFFFF